MKRTWPIATAIAGLVGGLWLLAGGPFPGGPSSTPTQQPNFLPGTPASAIETYLDADYAGERLERASWGKFKELVSWPREPAWDSAYVIRSFHIKSGKTTMLRAEAEVEFVTAGELDLTTYVYTPSPTLQIVPYHLERPHDSWKLALPVLRPHVSPPAAVEFLKRMATGYPRLKTGIEASIKAIEAIDIPSSNPPR